MFIPYRYRDALIEGYYNEDRTVTIHVTHPRVEGVTVYVAESWDVGTKEI